MKSMKEGTPISSFSHWEKVRMRAIKGFLAFSYLGALVATSMYDSDEGRGRILPSDTAKSIANSLGMCDEVRDMPHIILGFKGEKTG